MSESKIDWKWLRAQRVPDDYSWYEKGINACSASRVGHPEIPPWYTNELYDKDRSDSLTWWQKYVKAVGLKAAQAARQACIDGFVDQAGNWWCGQCYYRCQMINIGAQLSPAYPDAHDLYVIKETRDSSGYDHWLEIACTQQSQCMIEGIWRAGSTLLKVQRSIFCVEVFDQTSLLLQHYHPGCWEPIERAALMVQQLPLGEILGDDDESLLAECCGKCQKPLLSQEIQKMLDQLPPRIRARRQPPLPGGVCA
ncbi:MAG: hypothetical protein J2P36_24700, partial [Ktedonobacteraceae bacterium]|nr:hypothetical protein [Ktedonobacteraceae bacterium]